MVFFCWGECAWWQYLISLLIFLLFVLLNLKLCHCCYRRRQARQEVRVTRQDDKGATTTQEELVRKL